jgi:hypothetical protein
MGTRYFSKKYETEAEAKEATTFEGTRALATPCYSEVYVEGGPNKIEGPDGQELWEVKFKEYYG